MMGLNACIQQSHLMRTDSGDKPFCTDEFFVNALYLEGYVGYPFPYEHAGGELHPRLFLCIHLTGNLCHIALSSLIFERISYVASTTR
jgi:hypothetical protein